MNFEKLKGIIPANVSVELEKIPEINSNLRAAHFLSQCAHESEDFKLVEENLNYSAVGLHKIFGKYFYTEELINFQRKPEAIANRVYANRNGNGDEKSGDGWKFRGRGYIQITGRDNYEGFGEFIKEDCVANPDILSTKYPLESAAWFFTSNNIWSLCDHGSCSLDISAVTRKVNGGINGLDDRKNRFKVIYEALTADVKVETVTTQHIEILPHNKPGFIKWLLSIIFQ
jgi:putative chitinase